jgi:hypothetical protein
MKLADLLAQTSQGGTTLNIKKVNHMSEPIIPPLDGTIKYALRCALAGDHDKWRALPFNGVWRYQLENLARADSGGLQVVQRALTYLIDPQTLIDINRIDLSAPPPEVPKQEAPSLPDIFVPPLPKAAQLGDQAMQAAERVGGFIEALVSWVEKLSPMTPRPMLLSGAHFAISLAVARRCCLPIYKGVYPQFYILWVAPTSRYKKSTGALPIRRLIEAAIPHLLLPEDMTPEAAQLALAGKRPVNYDSLPQHEKTRIDQGIPHAARRGMYIDEVSSLFGAMKRKDSMQGFEELLLKGADNPDRLSRWTVGEGYYVLRHFNLNLLGLTTPRALGRNLHEDDWDTGLFARFLIMTPDCAAVYKLPDITYEDLFPPSTLVAGLQAIDAAMPPPPSEIELSSSPELPIIRAHMTGEVKAMLAAYTQAVTFDMLQEGINMPDERLHGGYSRLHEYAIKAALNAAIADWDGAGIPVITAGHWAHGQQFAELCRASLHRLLSTLEITEENRNEKKLLSILGRNSQGMTKRDLVRYSHLPVRTVETLLDVLLESGDVIAVQPEGKRTIIYKWCN